MSRLWNLEGLMAVRVLAAAQAPLAHIGVAVDRLAPDVDLALWALVGRTPQEALHRLNGGRAERPPAHPLRPRILTTLHYLRGATTADLARVLDADPDEVDEALAEAAEAGLVEADDPPPPAGREAMRWTQCARGAAL